jgi:hypothetical protein
MGVTNVGLNHCLDVVLHAATQVTTWYVGLIVDTSFNGLAPADTMSSHAGWTEGTSYAESTRQSWPVAAASGQLSQNTTALVTFTATAAQTIKGIFVCSDSAKSGTAGTLLMTRLFTAGDRTLSPGQQLQLTLQTTARDATPT